MKRQYTKHTKRSLTPVVKRSRSFREVMTKLGLSAAGGNYKIMISRIKNLGIDTSHFLGTAWRKGMKFSYIKTDLSKILCKGSCYSTGSPYQSGKIKTLLFNNNLKKKKCERCLIVDWLGKEIVFELHHVDGDSCNNEIDNLKILCPNCHSVTANFRGKNIRKPV